MPGQLRKTIEYALELWKDWNFNRMLGTKRVCVVNSSFLPTSAHPKCVLQVLAKNLWEENGMRKVGIHDLTIQSSFLHPFEKETLSGTWGEKRRNPRSSRPKISFTSAVPGQLCKTMDRICSRAMKRLTCWKDSRNYTCVCGAPCPFLHITTKVSNCRFLSRKLWKEKEMNYPIFFGEVSFEGDKYFEAKVELEGIEEERKKSCSASWSRFGHILPRGSEDIV